MDALVNDKQTYEELKGDLTSALHRKLNSTLLTLKKTNAIDNQRYYRLRCSVQQPSKLFFLFIFLFFTFFFFFCHRNFMVCRNYINLDSQSDLLFLSVVLRHANCPSTWRQCYSRSPTNPDVNYNPPRTLLKPLRLYRYQTTTN